MENVNGNDRREWVGQQLAHLDPPLEYQPDAAGALTRFHLRRLAERPRARWLRWPIWVTASVLAIVLFFLLPAGRVAAQQFWQLITVRQVAFIHVQPWPEGVPAPKVKLIGTVIPPIPARDVADAAWRVHYTPRMPRDGVLSGSPRISTTFSMAAGATVKVADLQLALQRARVTDLTVPAQWEGAQVSLHTSSMVLAEWPDILFAQSLPLTLAAPPGFDFSVFSALVLRVLGVRPEEAQRLAQKMGTAPVWLAPFAHDLEEQATMEEIALVSGPATLVEEKGKDGAVERTTLFWSVADRVFLISGKLSRELAILAANAVP